MIRDPSDGSVKGIGPNDSNINRKDAKTTPEGIASTGVDTAKHGPNYGLKTIPERPKSTFKAPSAEQLAQQYATHNLGFEPKSETPLQSRSGLQGD